MPASPAGPPSLSFGFEISVQPAEPIAPCVNRNEKIVFLCTSIILVHVMVISRLVGKDLPHDGG